MKYKKPPRSKKIVKNVAIGYKKAQKIKKVVKNPLAGIINILVDKAANMDTSRKQFGMQKERIQILDPDTGKWGVIDTKTNDIIRITSKPGQSYKAIKKVFPYKRDTKSRQCWARTKKRRRCRNLTSNHSGLCYLHGRRVSNRWR